MLARDISARHPNAVFVADVQIHRPFHDRSGVAGQRRQGALLEDRASYMKRYTFEQKALVGFEKSGPLLLPAAARTRL